MQPSGRSAGYQRNHPLYPGYGNGTWKLTLLMIGRAPDGKKLRLLSRTSTYIVTQHLRDRFRTATQTAAETPGIRQPRISASTVRRRLQVNLSARSPAIVTLLTPLRQQNRLNWTRIHQQNKPPMELLCSDLIEPYHKI